MVFSVHAKPGFGYKGRLEITGRNQKGTGARMIEAVLWDFGGVVTSSPFEAFNRLEAERGIPKDTIRRINAADHHTNAWARFERSELTLAEFDAAFSAEARAAGADLTGLDVISCLSGDVRPAMVQAIKRLKTRFKVGCLTNNVAAGEGPSMARSAAKAREVAAVMALFDTVVESSKVGLRKPDPKIYLLACERLGVAPAHVVYLDDLGINCKPAAELGMTAIKVSDPGDALAALEKAVGMELA